MIKKKKKKKKKMPFIESINFLSEMSAQNNTKKP